MLIGIQQHRSAITVVTSSPLVPVLAYVGRWSMKRTAVFLTDEQLADLQAIYRATGCKASESIRRAIDAYLTDQKDAIREGRKIPER